MRRRDRASLIVGTALLGLLVAASGSLAEPSEKLLVSRQSLADGGAPSDGAANPSISGSGRFVAFVSGSSNLSEFDDESPDGVFDRGIGLRGDIFVRDVVNEATILVSRGAASAGNAAADNASIDPSISSTGRYVAFTSAAANFSDGDRDSRISPATRVEYPVLDIFVRDLQSGDTILVSRRSGSGGAGGADSSYSPSISASGRFVAFASDAENLSSRDRRGTDVFVRDLARDRTILVSRGRRDLGRSLDARSAAPSISANGRFVAFASRATNLSRQDRGFDVDIYVRDLRRKRTILVSRGSRHGDATQPSVSSDGNLVAFVWEQRDRTRSSTDSPLNVHVLNVARGRTSLASVRGGAGPRKDLDAVLPTFATRGPYLAYVAQERDPFGGDDDRDADIYVRNLRARRTLLAAGSRRNLGVETSKPSLAARARFLAFDQEPNAHPGISERRQVYRSEANR